MEDLLADKAKEEHIMADLPNFPVCARTLHTIRKELGIPDKQYFRQLRDERNVRSSFQPDKAHLATLLSASPRSQKRLPPPMPLPFSTAAPSSLSTLFPNIRIPATSRIGIGLASTSGMGPSMASSSQPPSFGVDIDEGSLTTEEMAESQPAIAVDHLSVHLMTRPCTCSNVRAGVNCDFEAKTSRGVKQHSLRCKSDSNIFAAVVSNGAVKYIKIADLKGDEFGLKAALRVDPVIGRERVWLQYGHFRPPYAVVPLEDGKYSVPGRVYDVNVETSVPVNENNLELCNFMVAVSLLGGAGNRVNAFRPSSSREVARASWSAPDTARRKTGQGCLGGDWKERRAFAS
ncbi:hypothetical protein JCM10296v2_007073 [Rhodotorula toruloides]